MRLRGQVRSSAGARPEHCRATPLPPYFFPLLRIARGKDFRGESEVPAIEGGGLALFRIPSPRRDRDGFVGRPTPESYVPRKIPVLRERAIPGEMLHRQHPTSLASCCSRQIV